MKKIYYIFAIMLFSVIGCCKIDNPGEELPVDNNKCYVKDGVAYFYINNAFTELTLVNGKEPVGDVHISGDFIDKLTAENYSYINSLITSFIYPLDNPSHVRYYYLDNITKIPVGAFNDFVCYSVTINYEHQDNEVIIPKNCFNGVVDIVCQWYKGKAIYKY